MWGSCRARSPSGAAGTLGSLLGLLGRKKAGGCAGAPTTLPSALPVPQPGPCPALARPRLRAASFGDQPSPTCRNRGGPRSRGASTSALALPGPALGCGSALELPGTPWHCAGMQLSLLYMSPSAFRTRFCDLPIHYVKSSKIRNRFQPGNSVMSVFPPCFFYILMVLCLVRLLTCPGFPSPPFFLRGSPVNMYSGRAAPPTSPLHSHVLTCTMIFSKVLG